VVLIVTLSNNFIAVTRLSSAFTLVVQECSLGPARPSAVRCSSTHGVRVMQRARVRPSQCCHEQPRVV
jgi:hypothetical protein